MCGYGNLLMARLVHLIAACGNAFKAAHTSLFPNYEIDMQA
jgi:hypothetical protein